MTIFVSVPAYMERELESTVDSLINNAADPKALVISIFQQSEEKQKIKSSTANIENRWVHYSEAKGAGWARHKVQETFEDQDYYFSIDSHSLFEPEWDRKYIESIQKVGGNRTILSSWPMPYIIRDGEPQLNVHANGYWPVHEPHYTVIKEYKLSWVGSRRALGNEEYRWSHVGLAGQWFAYGHFVREIPYDPRIAWFGEEALMSIRSYCKGWKIYGTQDVLMYHNYERHGTPRVWTHKHKQFKEWNAKMATIQKRVVCGEDDTIYGIHNQEKVDEFMEESGLTDLRSRSMLIARQHGR